MEEETGIILGPERWDMCRSIYREVPHNKWSRVPSEFKCDLNKGHKGDHKFYDFDGLLVKAWRNYEDE